MKYLALIALLISGFCFSVFGQPAKTLEKRSAPAFSVVSMEGKRFNSADLKGKIVVLNLWFINCPFCVEEIRLLNQVVDEYKDNRDVVFIRMATNNKVQLESFLKKNPFKYNVIPSAMMQILSFGTPNRKGEINMPFPVHIVIDRDNKMVVETNGLKGVSAVKEELKRQFQARNAKSK
ncbi:MAG TPA: TlpA disulfide reductase family protein [Pyrinomonadaceae bacterium]|jgi:peroxiredoxin